jgi:hypothetical protein
MVSLFILYLELNRQYAEAERPSGAAGDKKARGKAKSKAKEVPAQHYLPWED